MINTTQEAKYATLTHDQVIYTAKEIGAVGNDLSITFVADSTIEGMNMSLAGKVVSINYYAEDETIATPATGHSASFSGLVFTYKIAGANVVSPIVTIEENQSINEIVYEDDYDDNGTTRVRFRIKLNASFLTFTQQDILDIYANASIEVEQNLEVSAPDPLNNLTEIGEVLLIGGQNETYNPATTIISYETHDIIDAYHHANELIKDLINVTVSGQHISLTSEITANLDGGQDEGDPILTRGLYSGMTEADLLALRLDLQKALKDLASGKQVISVTIGGKQVTKKLPEFAEVKQELASVMTALMQLEPTKYGKPRRRFLMDHRRRLT